MVELSKFHLALIVATDSQMLLDVVDGADSEMVRYSECFHGGLAASNYGH